MKTSALGLSKHEERTSQLSSFLSGTPNGVLEKSDHLNFRSKSKKSQKLESFQETNKAEEPKRGIDHSMGNIAKDSHYQRLYTELLVESNKAKEQLAERERELFSLRFEREKSHHFNPLPMSSSSNSLELFKLEGKCKDLESENSFLRVQIERLREGNASLVVSGRDATILKEKLASKEAELSLAKDEKAKLSQSEEEWSRKFKELQGEWTDFRASLGKIKKENNELLLTKESAEAEVLNLSNQIVSLKFALEIKTKEKEYMENELQSIQSSRELLQESDKTQKKLIKELEGKVLLLEIKIGELERVASRQAALGEALKNADDQVQSLTQIKSEKERKEFEISFKFEEEQRKAQELEVKWKQCSEENRRLLVDWQEVSNENKILKSKLISLQKKLHESEMSLTSLAIQTSSVEKLESQIKDLKAQVQIWKERCSELEEKNMIGVELDIKLKLVSKEMEILKEGLKEKEREVEVALIKCKDYERMSLESEKLKESFGLLQKELKSVNYERDEVVKELHSRPNEEYWNSKINQLKRQLDEASTARSEKSKEIKELQDQINRFSLGDSVKLKNIEKERDQLMLEVLGYQRDLDKLNENNQKLETQLRAYNRQGEETTWLKRRIEELEFALKKVEIEKESKFSYERTAASNAQSKCREIEVKLEELVIENNRLVEIVREKEKTIQVLLEQSRQSSGQEYRLELERVIEEKKELEKITHQLRQDVDSWRERAKELTAGRTSKYSQRERVGEWGLNDKLDHPTKDFRSIGNHQKEEKREVYFHKRGNGLSDFE